MSLEYHKPFDAPLAGKYAKVSDLIPKGARVLEVGCHTGYLMHSLKERGIDVSGVEYDPEAVKVAAAKGLDVRQANVEEAASLAGLKGPFDVILLLDVLEHLRAPEKGLENLKALLSPRGRIVVTAPNVAYWAVRKDLLLGRWEYKDGGIMDRTHLRFYTAQTWRSLLETSGFSITGFRPADGMIPGESLFRRVPGLNSGVNLLLDGAMKSFPKLFCISFLITAELQAPATSKI